MIITKPLTINIVKENETINIEIPYHLKDNFCSKFRSARWDKYMKRWELSKRTLKRLQQYVDTINQTCLLSTIEELESIEMQEGELKELNKSIDTLNREIETELKQARTLNEMKERLSKTKKILDDKTIELEKLRQQTKTLAESRQNEELACRKIVNEIIDINAVMQAKQTMIKNMDGLAKNKELYRDAQHIIHIEFKKLQRQGLQSRGLLELVNFNYNRPDRDNPKTFDDKLIYVIDEIIEE